MPSRKTRSKTPDDLVFIYRGRCECGYCGMAGAPTELRARAISWAKKAIHRLYHPGREWKTHDEIMAGLRSDSD